MQIRVCDDVETIADGWVAAIKAVVPDTFDVARMPDAKNEVSNLLTRKLAVEKGEAPLTLETAFDGIDVLVVDYDLLHLDETGSRTTGEGVARLARTFSSCGVVVVMNQFKGPQFDLGMRGHLDSFADVNVDANLVGRASLWEDLTPQDGQFDPTTWTPLPGMLTAVRGLSDIFEEKGFDAELMPIVGLCEAALAELSDTAFGFLSLDAETAADLAKVTVRGFLIRSLGEELVDTMCLHAPKIMFDFAASRIAKWLDRAVLRPMDVVIDGLHLVDRLPFIMDATKVDMADRNAWTAAASKPTECLRWDILEKYANDPASRVLGRPVFDWYRLANDDQIDALQDAYLDGENERFFLAEDTSRFVGRDDLTRYRADFHNFGDRRAIERLGDVTYGPLRRLTFG